jgi:hypothetical protein
MLVVPYITGRNPGFQDCAIERAPSTLSGPAAHDPLRTSASRLCCPVARTMIPLLVLLLASCGGQSSLPPLIRGATSGGGTDTLCEQAGPGSTPETAAHSPEIAERLAQAFPRGSPVAGLRQSLVRQGFELQGPCSPDGSVSWAQFRRNGNEVVANIYWREAADGRIMWTTGNVYFTFL